MYKIVQQLNSLIMQITHNVSSDTLIKLWENIIYLEQDIFSKTNVVKNANNLCKIKARNNKKTSIKNKKSTK